ncbi:winged helix-turn-helix domain-containing protein [Streptomyces sp. NPDC014892]|uniref:winged helix-turn-helix domain-containing protein n=1 Tax=Streptomyces sp. NPDC014892 TaxID=3364930 RepID=UPI0036FA7E76
MGWTLKRVELLIGRTFHVGDTIQGVWKLLRRHGQSAQVALWRTATLYPVGVVLGQPERAPGQGAEGLRRR